MKRSHNPDFSFFDSRLLQKIVPVWARPFTEPNHVKIVGAYYKYSAEWSEIGVADCSPDGWIGQNDPCIVVVGRK